MKASRVSSQNFTVRYGQQHPHSVRWGTYSYDSIPLVMGLTDQGVLCRLEFARGKTPTSVLAAWKKAWPETEFHRDQEAVTYTAQKIEAGRKLNLMMVGTEFQCAVWKNLLAIPAGEVVTYAELARRSKRPKAVRAVGTACGANPVPILVPCHRVIASDGSLGGFGGGLPTKIKLLKTEGFQQFKGR